MTVPLIAIRDLTRDFRVGGETLRVLGNISLEIGSGEYVSFVGPSGSGKSTLLQVLGCLDTPSSGSFRLAGEEVAGLTDDRLASVRNAKIGFVFQAFHLLARTSVLDNVLLPFSYRPGKAREHEALALEALALTRMAHRSRHWPNQLSGGERQRVAIARAIVTRPPLLLCDEPTGNLDRRTTWEIIEVFETLCQRLGMTLVMVTHDAEVARRARRLIRLVDGSVVYDGDPRGSNP
jgi:putative ABC transport system ATP-binding protein